MAYECVWGICVAFVFLSLRQPASALQPTVNYTLGTLVGLSDNVTDGKQQYTVTKFLGIPFAKPPTGDLRLRKPEPLKKLDSNPYNATFFRPYCVQGMQAASTSDGEDEDCLYLNVFVPTGEFDKDTGHAVMVWVYGGAFVAGLSNLYDGTLLAAVGNVIVVTLNYRVNFFGFFTTMDSAAPGNYGLFDQALAFEWIHDNIAAFGGDSKRVTIFGQSAGGMSVAFQALYPGNRGRFQRVVAQSGAAGMPALYLNQDRRNSAVRFANAVSCPSNNTNSMVQCLKGKPFNEIKSTVLQLTLFSAEVNFAPIIDNDIITMDYMFLRYRSSDIPDNIEFFQSLDFMSGINMYDGVIVFLLNVDGLNTDLNTFQPTDNDILNKQLSAFGQVGYRKKISESVRRAIFHEYTDWTAPSSYESNRLKLMELYTDFFFGVPSVDMLRHHEEIGSTGSTYSYIFTQVTTSRMSWTPSWLNGADHGEEARLVFGMGFQYMADFEKSLTSQIMIYWSNFAKSGNPNKPILMSPTWPMYNMSDQAYIELNTNTSRKQSLAARATHYWQDVVPALLENETESVPDVIQNCVSGAENLSSTFLPAFFVLMVSFFTGVLQ